MRKVDKIYNLLDYAIPAYLVVALLEYLLNVWTLEFGVKLFSIGLTLLFLMQKKTYVSNTFKTIMSVFLFYNLASIVHYILGTNGREIECYLSDLYNFAAAMLFFYVGFYDKREGNTFYNRFLLFSFAAMVIGLFFYVFMPAFHLVRHNSIMSSQWFSDTSYSDDSIISTMRFSGIIGTDYGVGNFCMFGLAIALFYYSENIKVYNLPMIIVALVFVIAGYMTQLRVVIVCISATVIYYLMFGMTGKAAKRTIKLVAVSAIFAFLLVSIISSYFGERASAFIDIAELTMDRMNFNSAYSERSGQVDAAFAVWDSEIFGNGMGSANSIASKNGHKAILDQCYAKMLIELGYVGISIFAIIIILSLFRCATHFRKYKIETIILVFVLCSMVGADTLYFHYFQIIPFWYALGRLWNPYKIKLRSEICNSDISLMAQNQT